MSLHLLIRLLKQPLIRMFYSAMEILQFLTGSDFLLTNFQNNLTVKK